MSLGSTGEAERATRAIQQTNWDHLGNKICEGASVGVRAGPHVRSVANRQRQWDASKAESLGCRIHCGCTARMRILSVRTQNSLRMRSENENSE